MKTACNSTGPIFFFVSLLFLPPTETPAADFTLSDLSVSYDFAGFTGSGFSPTPLAGQLDSNDIIVTGLNDGDLTFGGTGTTGDFALGSSAGGVTTGGVYAFDVSNGGTANPALGVQPGGSDFTPGRFVFQLVNNTGSDITQVDASFKIYYLNDQSRANDIVWEDSLDGVTFFPFDDITSPEAADAPASWVLSADTNVSVQFALGDFQDGDTYFFAFRGEDNSGSGSRDEFAIDDVSFTATLVPEPASLTTMFVGGCALLWRRRHRAKR